MAQSQFPLRKELLKTVDGFISYCRDLDIKTNKKLLEIFHKKNLLIPVARINPNIPLKKVILNENLNQEVLIPLEHLQEAKSNGKIAKVTDKKTYYKSGPICLGAYFDLKGESKYEVDFYIENNLLDFPAKDKKFKPWETYKTECHNSKNSNLKNYRVLLYSIDQVYILNYILRWRPCRFEFNSEPSKKLLLNLQKYTKNWLSSFDKSFSKGDLLKIIRNFKIYYKLFDFLTEFEHKIQKEFICENGATINEKDIADELIKKEFRKKANNLITKMKIKIQKVEEVRDFFLHAGFKDHEDMKTFKSNEFRPKVLKENRDTKMMADALNRIKIIENFYHIYGHTDWTSIEKIYGFRENIKTCDTCGNSFIIKNGRQNNKQTCSRECGKKLANKNRRSIRRK